MVVKSATKKKLMDMGWPEYYAVVLANNRRWDDVKLMSLEKIVWELVEEALLMRSGIIKWDRNKFINRIYSLANKTIIKVYENHKSHPMVSAKYESLIRSREKGNLLKDGIYGYFYFGQPTTNEYKAIVKYMNYSTGLINWPTRNPMEVKE